MWDSMPNVHKYVKSCEISIDAGTKDTYENKTRLDFSGLTTGSATIMATPVSVIATTFRSTTIFTPNNIVFGI